MKVYHERAPLKTENGSERAKQPHDILADNIKFMT